MELGIYTFADMAPESVAGKAHNTHRRIAELMEEIALADQVGLDVFAVGEHHRPEYAVSSPAVILGTYSQAGEEFFPAYSAMMNLIGKERGWSPMGRADFEAMRSTKGSLVVGSPSEVIDKILFEHELFGHSRFLAQMSMGTMPHDRSSARLSCSEHV